MNQKIAIWIPIHNQKVVVPTATATFATSNETFTVSQTPSISPSKAERKSFWELYYWCYTFSSLVRCYVLNVCECSSLAFYERFERKQGLSSLLYLKCSTSICRYIQEFFTSAKIIRGFEIIQQIVYSVSWPRLC